MFCDRWPVLAAKARTDRRRDAEKGQAWQRIVTLPLCGGYLV